MKKILLLLFIGATMAATAQNKKPAVVYKKAISFSPLALADIDNTLMLTGEYRLNDRVGLVTDAGYIFTSDYIRAAHQTRGFNIRPSVRWYYGKRNNAYLQLQGFYKQATYTLEDWVGKNCVNGIPAYEEFTRFGYRKKVAGANIIAGGLFPLSQSHRWLIDIYGGIGVRYKTHKLADDINGCYDRNTGWFFNMFQDNVTTVSLPMGLRITYAIK